MPHDPAHVIRMYIYEGYHIWAMSDGDRASQYATVTNHPADMAGCHSFMEPQARHILEVAINNVVWRMWLLTCVTHPVQCVTRCPGKLWQCHQEHHLKGTIQRWARNLWRHMTDSRVRNRKEKEEAICPVFTFSLYEVFSWSSYLDAAAGCTN